MSYRRGYQDGALEMLRAVERFLDPAGSVSEIIDQGVTGAIVDTMDEAVWILPG
jgi:hypothetical protein